MKVCYVANDGTVFTTEDECKNYESAAMKAWNKWGKEISIQWDNIASLYPDIYYIHLKHKEQVRRFALEVKATLCSTCPDTTGRWYWCEVREGWFNLDEEYERLNDIAMIFA